MAADLAAIATAIGATADEEPLVAELEQLSLEGIKLRGPQLDTQRTALKAQLLELASGATSTFIENADNLKAVHEDVRKLSAHLAALEADLPRAASKAEALQSEARAILSERERTNALLAKHAEVHELLEQPQRMETLVRNGLIDEALELESAARSRAIVHADVPAAAQVAAGVSKHMPALRASLLSQLAGPLQLPDALRVVSALRRMGAHALSEPDLRIAFLRNRTLCLAQAEASLPREPPHAFLLKYIDLCRVHWYDTVTHYRAVFAPEGDDDDAPKASSRSRAAPPTTTGQQPRVPRRSITVDTPPGAKVDDEIVVKDPDGVSHVVRVPAGPRGSAIPAAFDASVPFEKDGWSDPSNEFALGELAQSDRLASLLLSSWASERVDEFLSMLQAWLPRVREGDFVAYVLEQCAHCSRSLGRVGLDIAALARGPFREAVLRILDEGLEASEGHWRETIANHRWSTPHASAAAIANLQGGGGAAEAAGGAGGPPLALLQHPPVAVLTNHILTVFNELRTCAPYELRGSFFERVRVRLLACVKILADALQQQPSLGGGGAGASTSHAKEHYASLCKCMAEVMVPHVASCLDQLIPCWAPPAELLPTGTSAAPAKDEAVAALVEAVTAALRPLYIVEAPIEAAVEAERTPLPLPVVSKAA